jgi:putative RecB family exonuclease
VGVRDEEPGVVVTTTIIEEAHRARLETIKSQPRSVSQLQQYQKCGYAFYLQRVARVWQRPAAWLPQGTAFHSAAEEYEKSDRTMTLAEMEEAFRTHYAADVNRLCDETPRLDFWFRSGPYDGEKDIERRYKKGLEQVERYHRYYEETHPEQTIWVAPDGTPGIELSFNIGLGGVRVRGFIDAVVIAYGRVIVRDNKTGKKPGNELQLAVYAEAIRQTYGEPINHGDYWMAEKGKPTVLYDLFEWGSYELATEFDAMDQGVKAERFEPQPDPDKCMFCPVSHACRFAA